MNVLIRSFGSESPRQTFLRAAAVFVTSATLLLIAPITQAGSIFDDDYTPPKRAQVTPPPTAPIPAPAPPETPAPAPQPTVHRPDAPAVNPTSVARTAQRAVPDRASRAKCRKLFEEVYATELKDSSPVARRKLAQTLLDEAAKSDAGSPDRFVLLNGAIQAAEEGQNLPLCFDAARKLADAYDIDEAGTEADAVTKAFAGRPSPALATSETVEVLDDLARRVIENDEPGIATQLEPALQRASQIAADVATKTELKNRAHEVAVYRETREKIAPALEKLKTSPQDPAANLTVGSFICFRRAKWDEGLPFLAKSGDAALKDLAALELSWPAGVDAMVALADKWFAAASRLTPPDRAEAMKHADDLYQNAEAGLTGLQKLAIDKKLAQIPQTGGLRHVDLLKMFDPASSIVKGTWRMEDGALVAAPEDGGRIQFAYQPPQEYDFRISFTLRSGERSVAQICYAGGHSFNFQVGGEWNKLAGFEMVDGEGLSSTKNKSVKKKTHWLIPGQHYTSVVKVRKTGVEAYVNGELISALKTDYLNLSLHGFWGLPHDNSLGLGQVGNSVRFDAVELIEITGNGKRILP